MEGMVMDWNWSGVGSFPSYSLLLVVSTVTWFNHTFLLAFLEQWRRPVGHFARAEMPCAPVGYWDVLEWRALAERLNWKLAVGDDSTLGDMNRYVLE